MGISEFRFNRRRRHPSYVYKKRGNRYYAILITHAPKTGNRDNIELFENPNPKSTRTSYLIPRPVSDEITSFDRPKPSWRFNRHDKRKVKRIKKTNRRVD